MEEILRVAVAGGGTGGHLFPALNIVDAIKNKWKSQFIFFGTSRGIENKKVPEKGYELKIIPVAGFHRRFTIKNLSFPFKLLKSVQICKRELSKFKPHLVLGTGGYVMGPVLRSAIRMGIPTVIQEQNSFPGFTTRILAKRTDIIFLGYDDAKDFLQDAKKLVSSGNPIKLESLSKSKEEIYKEFNLDKKLKTILVFGGSQGALNINKAIEKILLEKKIPDKVQILWQTGTTTFDEYKKFAEQNNLKKVVVRPFFNDMRKAYTVADFTICRAGAITLAELMAEGISAILVPLPNSAGDHQFKNAQALAEKNAAIVVKDDELLVQNLSTEIEHLSKDKKILTKMSKNIHALSRSDTMEIIINSIEELLKERYKNSFVSQN